MSNIQDLVDDYIAMWNETDPTARARLAEQVWEPEASYVDPMAEANGRETIDATIGAVQGQFPGMSFALAGEVDAHHNLARFNWQLGTAQVPDMVVGFDVAVISDGGKLQAVHGFLDKVPAELG
ncbi:SnoaL-like protein [Antricoccus suffuscus]|uniref:SnoaL-like protein n=1 Tax=Antricoccus suffuscus TaxID=1629062 RepID=A0A2T1A054_9ACTN|nr:nuclear transport factor 2 family protein [Antricoccus suffuscus]PRZ41989.1 SnoaL-like protein [Antricoccus suffuscus]